MDFAQQLEQMGFSKRQVEKALVATQNVSIEAAIEWISEHQDDPDPSSVMTVSETNTVNARADVEESTVEISIDAQQPVAQSFKCEDCNKIFKSSAEVEFHAVKSGHVNFSESSEAVKPLTDEERKAKALALQQKLKERRQKEEQEKQKKEIDMEKQRRVQGQELAAAKERHAQMEMQKIADERKRQKIEDQKAKQRILDQIKADREKKKSEQAGYSAPVEVEKKPEVVVPPPEVKKDYESSQIQIRLPNGSTLRHSFSAKETLSAIRLFVGLNRTDGDTSPFRLMAFPKRVFTEEDMEAPLNSLGLVPSAVLIVTKAV